MISVDLVGWINTALYAAAVLKMVAVVAMAVL